MKINEKKEESRKLRLNDVKPGQFFKWKFDNDKEFYDHFYYRIYDSEIMNIKYTHIDIVDNSLGYFSKDPLEKIEVQIFEGELNLTRIK